MIHFPSSWPSANETAPSAMAWSTSLHAVPPLLTSDQCAHALTHLFQDPIQLAIATEASSHPSGLVSLFAQPYVYAGGGLGNLDECTAAASAAYATPLVGPLQNCLAGAAANQRDSLTVASVCMVPDCTALDLAAADFGATVARAATQAQAQNGQEKDWQTAALLDSLAQDYMQLLGRIAELNGFLNLGWTCGELVVPWAWGMAGPYLLVVGVWFALGIWGTIQCRRQRRRQRRILQQQLQQLESLTQQESESVSVSERHEKTSLGNDHDDDVVGLYNQEGKQPESCTCLLELQLAPSFSVVTGCTRLLQYHQEHQLLLEEEEQQQLRSMQSTDSTETVLSQFWSCFDISRHARTLIAQHSPESACLDGLRVGSIFWIMLGHVMAIVSSSGAGYSNPAQFLPPHGLTTTVPGQLLFSSRFAVDTFLCLSGWLVVYVLDRKLPLQQDSNTSSTSYQRAPSVLLRYLMHLPSLLLTRLIRIFPLYLLTFGFYTLIAPHLGHGPFWYQWLALLQPCGRDSYYGMTNLLFINNFLPADRPITDTCFYHSWYLAVDMQLFLLAPLLVFWHQARPRQGKVVTILLFLASVTCTCYWTWVRNWSVNTFDGAAVVRYDVEAYAKPHIRAQAYLAGMLVAMLLPTTTTPSATSSLLPHRSKSSSNSKSSARRDGGGGAIALILALVAMLFVTFVTAAGAYARRPCQYKERPQHDPCGSLWSPTVTMLYSGLSRTVWVVGVATLLHLCCYDDNDDYRYSRPQQQQQQQRRQQPHMIVVAVASILSWPGWAPLSHLSFGAYLIHPIVIFIWQLGDREKQVFRLLTFAMDYISVCVVSYVCALLAALFVELPCAALWKYYYTTDRGGATAVGAQGNMDANDDESKISSSCEHDEAAAEDASKLCQYNYDDADDLLDEDNDQDRALSRLLGAPRGQQQPVLRYGSYDLQK